MPDQPTPRSDDPATGTSAGPTPPTPAPQAAPTTAGAASAKPGGAANTGPADPPGADVTSTAPTAPTPPTQSASVAAETAPAQRTEGPSTVVDSVPPAPVTPVYRHGMFGVVGSGDTSGFGGLQRRVPFTPSTPKPWGGWFDGLDATLAAVWPPYSAAVERSVVDRGELTLYVAVDQLLGLLRVLRNDPDLRFELLSSVSGVHYPDDPAGRPLHSVYHLTSMTYRRTLRVETAVTDAHPHVPSATPVYPTADWQERETWDMFGIVYDGHPGLTRIEMPDDWVGHPQRKDYPLGGIPVEYKGATIPPPDRRRAYQ